MLFGYVEAVLETSTRSQDEWSFLFPEPVVLVQDFTDVLERCKSLAGPRRENWEGTH